MQKKLGIVVVVAIQTPSENSPGKRPGLSHKAAKLSRKVEPEVSSAAA